MQILDSVQSLLPVLFCPLLAESQSFSFVQSLPFNPIKLLVLVAWIYLCLYLVQYMQFSLLLPKKYKPVAYIITLFAGPILLLVLLIIDTIKKSFWSDKSFPETVTQQLKSIFSHLRPISFKTAEDDATLRLLDSSGRTIDEIYGHSDDKRLDSRVLNLTEQIIADALERRASDILIDPKDESTYTVRLRIDGILRTVQELKAANCKSVINSIKAVSSMDISDKRRPQDGAFIAKRGQTTASFRVASAGVINGEKLSIRILNQDASTFKLAEMGLTKKQHSTIRSMLDKPSGMILICGPTGSGKTTTMYAMLNEIERFTRNVITVEDPIEAVLQTTSQIEINPKADITFAKTLRSVLRQDPDVICVGEIRDEETAEIALRAAQTGHLVLATIHCDSNATALVRLLDLGVSPIMLSSGLSLLISQRLLRRLCEHCKRPAQLSEHLIHEFQRKGIEHENMFEAKGCKHCEGTGYFGRTAVCDLMIITDELKADIANNVLISDLRTENRKKDSFKLQKDGLRKVAAGITSLAEMKRVIG